MMLFTYKEDHRKSEGGPKEERRKTEGRAKEEQAIFIASGMLYPRCRQGDAILMP
jgi:hypothetical protein